MNSLKCDQSPAPFPQLYGQEENDERHEEDAIGATPRLVEHGKV